MLAICFQLRFHAPILLSVVIGLGACNVPQFAPSGAQEKNQGASQIVNPGFEVGPYAARLRPLAAAGPDEPASEASWDERLQESHWGAAAAWGVGQNIEVFTDVDAHGNAQLFASGSAASGQATVERRQLTFDAQAKLDPAVVYAPSIDTFIVVYTAQTAGLQRGIYAATLNRDLTMSSPVTVAEPELNFDSPRAVWVDSRQQIFAVFHSQTAVYGAWISPRNPAAPASTAAFALIEDRHGYVSSPTVAYAATTDQLMVAWGVMRSQENIELGVMRPADQRLSVPNMQTWSHKRRECSTEMAPACIEGGDRPALAYNKSLRKFGLAIADDLNDGSRVEAFLLDDSCSPAACDAQKIGHDDFPERPSAERERALATIASVASVAIAPIQNGFMVGFAFGDKGPSEPERVAVTSFNNVGQITAASEVSDIDAKHVALSSAGATGLASNAANLLFRERLATGPEVRRQSVMIHGSGATPGGRPMHAEL